MAPRKRSLRLRHVCLDDSPSKTFSLRGTGSRGGVLNHIFDGGMRIETRITREALLARRRRARVWRVLAALAAIWILFQFVPVG